MRAVAWAVVAVLLALVALGVFGRRVARSHPYVTGDAGVTVGPVPAHLRSRPRALREGPPLLATPVSILDSEAFDAVRRGLLARPWIAAVPKVRRIFPAGFHATVVFREPVGVLVADGGRWALDREGFVLESDSPFEAKDVAEIRVLAPWAGLLPKRAGERVFDEATLEGLDVLASLAPLSSHPALASAHVLAVEVGQAGVGRIPGAADIHLVLERGPRLRWGRSPRSPYAPLERTPSEKLDSLAEAARVYPSFQGAAVIDLRFREARVVPREGASSSDGANRGN